LLTGWKNSNDRLDLVFFGFFFSPLKYYHFFCRLPSFYNNAESIACVLRLENSPVVEDFFTSYNNSIVGNRVPVVYQENLGEG